MKKMPTPTTHLGFARSCDGGGSQLFVKIIPFVSVCRSEVFAAAWKCRWTSHRRLPGWLEQKILFCHFRHGIWFRKCSELCCWKRWYCLMIIYIYIIYKSDGGYLWQLIIHTLWLWRMLRFIASLDWNLNHHSVALGLLQESNLTTSWGMQATSSNSVSRKKLESLSQSTRIWRQPAELSMPATWRVMGSTP